MGKGTQISEQFGWEEAALGVPRVQPARTVAVPSQMTAGGPGQLGGGGQPEQGDSQGEEACVQQGPACQLGPDPAVASGCRPPPSANNFPVARASETKSNETEECR